MSSIISIGFDDGDSAGVSGPWKKINEILKEMRGNWEIVHKLQLKP